MIMTGLCRLGRDAEIRRTPDNTAVANLSLAYNYGKKDAEGHRPTQWVSASLWGERAEKLAEYLTKGTLLNVVLEDVYIESYDKKDGGTGTNLKARVSSLEFAGGKREDGEKSEPRKATQPEQPKPRQQAKGGAFDTMDDDIPFDNPYRGIRAYVV